MRRDRSKLPDWPAGMRAETAAAYLDVSIGTLAILVKTGRLPAPRVLTGSTKVYRRQDLDRLLDLEKAAGNHAGEPVDELVSEWDRACSSDGARGPAIP